MKNCSSSDNRLQWGQEKGREGWEIDPFHNNIQFKANDVIHCAARNLHHIIMLQLHDGCNLRNPELGNLGIRNCGTMESRNLELRNYGTTS